MNPQIKQKLEELTDLISKSKIEGSQHNQGATIKGKMIFDSKTNFKKGIWKRVNRELVEYVLTPKK